MKEEPHTLGFLLGRAAATMATLLNQTLKSEGIDLPHSQFVILRHLYNEDGISQQELAERIFKDNAAIKRTLDNLEQKKLIQRVHVTQRKNSILITEEGKQLLPQVLQSAEKAMRQILKDISYEDYQHLREMLEKIFRNTL